MYVYEGIKLIIPNIKIDCRR